MKLVPKLELRARIDVSNIIDYFDERSDSVGDKFQESVNETIDLLCDFPDSGEPFPLDPSGKTRRRTVFNFKNYVIYFRQENETLQIIRIVHGARDDKTLFSPPQP